MIYTNIAFSSKHVECFLFTAMKVENLHHDNYHKDQVLVKLLFHERGKGGAVERGGGGRFGGNTKKKCDVLEQNRNWKCKFRRVYFSSVYKHQPATLNPAPSQSRACSR